MRTGSVEETKETFGSEIPLPFIFVYERSRFLFLSFPFSISFSNKMIYFFFSDSLPNFLNLLTDLVQYPIWKTVLISMHWFEVLSLHRLLLILRKLQHGKMQVRSFTCSFFQMWRIQLNVVKWECSFYSSFVWTSTHERFKLFEWFLLIAQSSWRIHR